MPDSYSILGGEKVRISRIEWEELLSRIDCCEKNISEIKVQTENLINITAKRILEQPEELLKELNGLDDIDRTIDSFIRS